METLNQNNKTKMLQTKKTVEWLINNTKVRTFNNITFSGYQRQVNSNHVKNIKNYIENMPFFFPTSIICATKKEFTQNEELFIVDGQHRVEAFRSLKEENIYKYNEIKNYELSVVVLENPTEEVEINTFITINKTSKKVDTSLAYVLKNKINRKGEASSELSIAKKEFLAVELAYKLNQEKNNLWTEKIMFEGNPTKKTYATISLNAFVKSTRVLISYLEKKHVITLDWRNESELQKILQDLFEIYLVLWNSVEKKWPRLFIDSNYTRNVIQGNIGVTVFNRYIIMQLKNNDQTLISKEELIKHIQNWVKNINVSETAWYSGNEFSKYSSESGFTIIADTMYKSSKK